VYQGGNQQSLFPLQSSFVCCCLHEKISGKKNQILTRMLFINCLLPFGELALIGKPAVKLSI
jgi:hypothetical protein